MKQRIKIHILGWLMIGAAHSIAGDSVDYANHPGTDTFIQAMVTEYGFDQKYLEELFGGAIYKDRIIELMTSPAEAKPWRDYRPILVTEQRVKQGDVFMRKHIAALERAEDMYGVPAELIVAIIGVETRYGRVTGGFRVLDALSTLAFNYPKRSKFFTKELREFLILTRDEKMDPTELKGSYAGAMGYGQFMPSSFRAYAIDFDGDGHKDIWGNPVDAIGSVANYFHRHGWKPDEPVTSRAKPSGNGYEGMIVKTRKDLKPKHTLTQILAAGITAEQPFTGDQPATLMKFEAVDGDEFWVGLHNFYVITRYNHSALYAMAVYQLSREIGKQDYAAR